MSAVPLFDVAEKMILEPSGLDEGRLSSVLGKVMSRGVDYADLYFQLSREESWSLEDGIVKDGSHNIEQGVGVRAISGEKTGFAYTDEVLLPALVEASDAARAIARSGASSAVRAWQRPLTHRLYLPVDPLDAMRDEDKVDWLMRIDAQTRRIDPRVKQVMASLAAVHEVVLIASSDGTLTADVRPLVRINVSVIVEQNGRREQGYSGGGGRFGLDELLRGDEPFGYGREAVRQALVNLEAVAAPAGSMTVVLGPGWPGILLHEAIGHGLEGDFNRKGTSAFSNRIGQKVAADEITVVDDGTLDRRRGSLNVDDEGTPTQCTVLIENGVLRGYIQDKMNARLMGMAPTGNGRRESFAHMTLPRMTNTYMRAGSRAPRGDHRIGREGLVRGEFRRRPGGYHIGQIRVLGERGLLDRERQDRRAGERRDLDRQRPRCADPRQHGGQRHAARRRRRDVRQGRSIGACRSRTTHSAHRCAHGGRYRLEGACLSIPRGHGEYSDRLLAPRRESAHLHRSRLCRRWAAAARISVRLLMDGGVAGRLPQRGRDAQDRECLARAFSCGVGVLHIVPTCRNGGRR